MKEIGDEDRAKYFLLEFIVDYTINSTNGKLANRSG
jgi:hypothetical protein